MWRLRWSYVPHRSLHNHPIASDVHLACNSQLPTSLLTLISSFHNQQLIVKTYTQIHRVQLLALDNTMYSQVFQYTLISIAARWSRPCIKQNRYYSWKSTLPRAVDIVCQERSFTVDVVYFEEDLNNYTNLTLEPSRRLTRKRAHEDDSLIDL
jgi:hypothetical protein